MLGLLIFDTLCIIFVVVKVIQIEKTVDETHSSLDAIKRLLIGIFTKARKDKQSEVS
jgi:hypothetical protein